ncbi:MAG: hypothetical protein HYT20_00270 [Candidatus Nealsonbacteria bacterium]|nr:hypothetical protein [Candidatus Nealsonbacteria bacterium]
MRNKIILGMMALMIATFSLACTDQELQRRESIDTRAAMFARAEAKIPVPRTENFPLRAVLAEYTRRQDLVNHEWYTYIMSDTGAVTHYFVSTTVPVNSCAFLSSTEDAISSSIVLTAPSLDGIYYGGSGAAAVCNGWIFIDAATGAMGLVFGAKILTFDAPLILETEPLLIRISNSNK